MFHKIRLVVPLKDYVLMVQFSEGLTKIYNVEPLFNKFPIFQNLKIEHRFLDVKVDVGGNAITWDDDIDLSCDELFENGKTIKNPFDGLLAFSDATYIWGLNESTLRKAVVYGKLKEGVDVCKFGKQWVITYEAMTREYGLPELSKKKKVF